MTIKNFNKKPFFFIFVAVSVITLYLAALVKGDDLRNLLNVLRLIPTVVTVDGIAYLIFAFWLWRLKFFQKWLVPFPDLNGTWHGHIQSNWGNPDEDGVLNRIPVVLTIKQTFDRLSCVMRTSEMESHSYAEGFCIDVDDQIRRLCLSYTCKPDVALRERSTPHDGTIIFNIIGDPVSKLEGEYWTQRKTTGNVVLTFRTRKLLDEIPTDLAAHPMSQLKK